MTITVRSAYVGRLAAGRSYLVMATVAVAPAFFPRALDCPVTVLQQRATCRNGADRIGDTIADQGGTD